ncbi:metal ABC transporter permease [Botrimarina sp.]|uniref:metal ABC transporter permease n=1 Tax=Botrimarina sp. TaxID=2795802 RepID=UPI0032ECB413
MIAAAFGDWSDWRGAADLLLLRDYNTRVVVLGATLLGLTAGVVGSFTLLRKRALLGDALAHATLPGIAIAFLAASALGADGKSLPLLLAGAAATGVLGVGAILAIRRFTRLKEDAALGIVLSVFFGAGAALLGVVQQTPTGHAAGLESFIYGKTAAMLSSDAWLIAGAAVACLALSALCFKELMLLCFDAGFASARGFSAGWLDTLLMGMVVLVTIIGLQAVGLVLMIALLVIPPAAARFWTDRLLAMTLLAGAIGAASAFAGAVASAAAPKLPSGAMIVLCAASLFLFSALLGSRRGLIVRYRRRRRFLQRIAREHLLRAVYEATESADSATFARLLEMRSWGAAELRQLIRRARHKELVQRGPAAEVRLTSRGLLEAQRLTRQHRLWEMYLITHADVAPSRVDRGADAIEHVLDPETIDELERLLDQRRLGLPPESPHAIDPAPEEAPR